MKHLRVAQYEQTYSGRLGAARSVLDALNAAKEKLAVAHAAQAEELERVMAAAEADKRDAWGRLEEFGELLIWFWSTLNGREGRGRWGRVSSGRKGDGVAAVVVFWNK